MFNQLLEKLALELESRDIDYMIIGGQAVLLYGEPRLTRDIDVTLGASSEQLADVLALVERLRWKIRVDAPETFVSQHMVLPCLDPKTDIRIDLIFSSSLYEQQAMRRVRRVAIGKARVRFVSAEDLIIHKLIAGRPRDLQDARTVWLKNPGLDARHIRKWLRQFEASLSQPFLKRFEKISK